MKIDIITFHDTANNGATLQCCALSRYLEKHGAYVEVIDYMPLYVCKRKRIFKSIEPEKGVKHTLRTIKNNIITAAYSSRIKKRNRRFDEFIHNNIRLTRRYENEKDLFQDPPEADLYICGSDQIWNPVLTGGELDNSFFLRFAKGRKSSYGVSVGEVDVGEYKDEYLKLTADLDAISVRERSSARELSKVLGKTVEVVADCTLLLDETDYSLMERSDIKIDEPYLLLYNIQHSLTTIAIARREAEKRGLIIVDISPKPFKRVTGAIHLFDIGPAEFLSLFRGASFVVTNSFHGCTFSVIYKKQFVTVPHTVRFARMVDLMETLDIRDRIAYDSAYEVSGEIDYKRVYDNLNDFRADSYAYIDSILVSVDQ